MKKILVFYGNILIGIILYILFFHSFFNKYIRRFGNDYIESRRSRRFAVSMFTTVGNYEYGFYYYFYQGKLKEN